MSDQSNAVTRTTMLKAATSPAVSNWCLLGRDSSTVQVTLVGDGEITAEVDVEYGNDGIGALLGIGYSLSGTTVVSEGDEVSGRWAYIRTNLKEITGTNAALTSTMGS